MAYREFYLKIECECTDEHFQKAFKQLAKKVSEGDWDASNMNTEAAGGGAGQQPFSWSVKFVRGREQHR